jgi:hypothetical protein
VSLPPLDLPTNTAVYGRAYALMRNQSSRKCPKGSGAVHRQSLKMNSSMRKMNMNPNIFLTEDMPISSRILKIIHTESTNYTRTLTNWLTTVIN